MKDELISFETAKLAKEKGFDVPVRYGVYGVKMKLTEDYGSSRNPRQIDINWNSKNKQQDRSQATSVPTQSLLQKWLREVHGIQLAVGHNDEDYYVGTIKRKLYYDNKEQYVYKRIKGDKKYVNYDTYEQALEVGLLEGLKVI